MSRHILITGAAGFIGYSLAARLLQQGEQVLGIDNLNHYYDVQLKQARLARLQAFDGFHFAQSLKVAHNGTITTTSGGSAHIVAPNVNATNGVIHVIDAVVLPPSATE